jgi:hypothetical protein
VLDQLITGRGDTYANASAIIGRNPTYIQQFIKRGTPRKLDEDDRRSLARYFGVPEEMLGGSDTPMVATRISHDLRVVHVPRLSLDTPSASRPAGREPQTVAFDESWLSQIGAKPDKTSILRIVGDAMAPTLNDGEEILVDHEDGRARLRDGIYLLSIDGSLTIKRTARCFNADLVQILNDNPLYPTTFELEVNRIESAARVRWCGKRLR